MPGNITSFDNIDIVRCFLLLDEYRSRLFIKKELEIGEGSIRGILNVLKSKKLIFSTRMGHMHTKKGKEIYDLIKKEIKFPLWFESKAFMNHFFPIYSGCKSLAGVLFRYNKTFKNIFIYRDFAIKAGAEGALILKYEDQNFSLPDYDYSKHLDMISKLIDVKKNCLVIIVVGKTKSMAERGIISVLINLSNIFNSII